MECGLHLLKIYIVECLQTVATVEWLCIGKNAQSKECIACYVSPKIKKGIAMLPDHPVLQECFTSTVMSIGLDSFPPQSWATTEST